MKNLGNNKSTTRTLAALTFCATAFLIPAATAEHPTGQKKNNTAAVNPTSGSAYGATGETGGHALAVSGRSGASLQIASEEAKDRTDRKLAGHHVRGSDGKDLGSVKDFLIDLHSGEVAFGVVSSGGVGSMGDKLRLVPFKALQAGTKKDEFSVMLDKTQWNQVPTVKVSELKTGRFTLGDEERRTLAERFRAKETSASDASGFYTAGLSSQLVCATELRDKNVRSGTTEIGSIEGVVIDRESGMATALFDPKKDRSTAHRKFLVPLNQFTFASGKREPATTQLTVTDFEHASSDTGTVGAVANPTAAPAVIAASDSTQGRAANTQASTEKVEASATIAAATPAPSADATADATQQSSIAAHETPATSPGIATTEDRSAAAKSSSHPYEASTTAPIVASSSPRSSADENLTPTGATSADQNPKGADSGLISSARAVRKSLDEDEALARLDVNVTPEGGKLVLRGTVASEEIKSSIEKKAKSAVHAIGIDNQLKVENK